jgi:alpha-L-arabinofuranosidase
MKYRFLAASALLAISFAAPCLRAQSAAALTIDLKQQKAPVSPMLYGIMTEEINYSYDGGLYAELIRNRTFQSDWTGILNWFLVEKGTAAAKISQDKSDGPSKALTVSGKIEVTKADAGNRAGIMNEGYWGMAARPNTRYTGSFYAKSDAQGPLPVRLALVADQTGLVLASTTVPVSGAGWQQYKFELRTTMVASVTAENHFEMTIDRPATLWLQMVSLFPPTYKNRPNGNRPDIMEKLAAMRPTFLRFPGGNYVEGSNLANRYDWKKTIGPMVDRPTHESPWSYRSSDGMGLLEFLNWCEDLKIQPILAIFAGYTLDNRAITGAALEPYVQDALDEIEYITGGPETKWGAVRARDGHAAPFQLSYVEVGNEDQFDRAKTYDERFGAFAKAIRAKYPNIKLIATLPVKGSTPDILDDHYYRRQQEMYEKHDQYDKADRNGPKIFVGEWATREGSPTPNFGAALGDSAWMTGMERNSDLIVMAGYAPLFVNVNPGGMQWWSDLIGYDAVSSYGSPSYYAQVMFASCVGDHTVDASLTGGGGKLFFSATTAPGKACLKLVNASSNAQPVTLNLKGLGAGAHTAKVQTMHATTTSATNTIKDPKRIVPVSSTASLSGETTAYVVPAYTVQVLEIDLK